MIFLVLYICLHLTSVRLQRTNDYSLPLLLHFYKFSITKPNHVTHNLIRNYFQIIYNFHRNLNRLSVSLSSVVWRLLLFIICLDQQTEFKKLCSNIDRMPLPPKMTSSSPIVNVSITANDPLNSIISFPFFTNSHLRHSSPTH